jgi:hypothetical protein
MKKLVMLRTKSSIGDSNSSGGRENYYYDNYNNEKKNEKKTNMTTTTTTEMISNSNSIAAVGDSSVENHISFKLTLGIHQSKTIQEHEVKQEGSTKTDATQDDDDDNDDDDDDNDCPSFAEEGTNYDDVDVEEGKHQFPKSCSSSFIGWVPQIVTFPSTLDDEEERSALLANSTLTSNYYSSIDYYNIDSNNNESISSSEEFCFTTLMAMLGMLSVGLLFGAYISNYFITI